VELSDVATAQGPEGERDQDARRRPSAVAVEAGDEGEGSQGGAANSPLGAQRCASFEPPSERSVPWPRRLLPPHPAPG